MDSCGAVVQPYPLHAELVAKKLLVFVVTAIVMTSERRIFSGTPKCWCMRSAARWEAFVPGVRTVRIRQVPVAQADKVGGSLYRNRAVNLRSQSYSKTA